MGDMVALGAKHYTKCLVGLYNCARKVKAKRLKSTGEEEVISRIAFAELVMYIEETRFWRKKRRQYSSLVIWHSLMCHEWSSLE